MQNDFKIDDLISIINQMKSNENQNYQPVSQPFFDNSSQIANLFTQVASNLQQNSNNANTEDLSKNLSNILNSLNQNNSSNGEFNKGVVQNNQQTGNQNDFLNNILGNLGNNKNSQNNDIFTVLSSVLGGNNGGNSTNANFSPNILTNVLPALKNFQNTSISDPRMNLLTAVKPFVNDSFSPHIDHGIRLVSIAKMTKSTLGGLNNLGDISKIK